MTATYLGIDPGARATGLCVIRGRFVLDAYTVTTDAEQIFPTTRAYLRDVIAHIHLLLQTLPVDVIAVESLHRPTWYMAGRAKPIDPTSLLAAAEVLGSVKSTSWDQPLLQIEPGGNGSQVLGAYPPELVSDAERRKPGWQLRVGGGSFRHKRSAFDVAMSAQRIYPTEGKTA